MACDWHDEANWTKQKCWLEVGGGVGPGADATCCSYTLNCGDGTKKSCIDLANNPFPESPREPLGPGGLTQVPKGKQGAKNMSGCAPKCGCPTPSGNPSIPGSNGVPVHVQPRSGGGQNLCWGAAGGRASPTDGGAPAVIPAGAAFFVTVTVRNYGWLKARKLTMTFADPTGAQSTRAAAAQVRVTRVEAVGRNVLGSAQGISGSAVDSTSENALTFGQDIPPINSANAIFVEGVNNSPVALEISADVEGEATQ